jgi:hypothetical protein
MALMCASARGSGALLLTLIFAAWQVGAYCPDLPTEYVTGDGFAALGAKQEFVLKCVGTRKSLHHCCCFQHNKPSLPLVPVHFLHFVGTYFCDASGKTTTQPSVPNSTVSE